MAGIQRNQSSRETHGSHLDVDCHQYGAQRSRPLPPDTQSLRSDGQLNIFLTLAYDGSSFFGWQEAGSYPSIEGTLKRALQTLFQQEISLNAASRTDRGVHAEGQIVNFFIDKPVNIKRLTFALNSLLPPTLRVLDASLKPLDFHPTLHALQKEYRYKIETNEVLSPFDRFTHWHYPYSLDIKKMKEAAQFFVGEHDFRAFQNKSAKENTWREIISLTIEGDKRLDITIRGKSFLYKMVRNIVGTLVYVGRGKIDLQDIQSSLKEGLRYSIGKTAPAHGLTLKRVYY